MSEKYTDNIDEIIAEGAPSPQEHQRRITEREHIFGVDKKTALARYKPRPPKPDWPDSLFNPTGIVGEVFRAILDTARIPQPKFALASALTLCGGLLGRGVKDTTGQRTNLFTLALAPSSSGKNHPLQFAQKILDAIGYGELWRSQVTSDSAVEYMLAKHPSRVLYLDEVGEFLGSLKMGGATNPALRSVMPCLKEIWSKGGGIYTGKTRSKQQGQKNWEDARQIANPHLAVYGTGAPSRFWETIDPRRDFDDGTLPRFLVFQAAGKIPAERDLPEATVSAELQEAICTRLQILDIQPPPKNSEEKIEEHEPMTFAMTEAAAKMFGNFIAEKNAYISQAAESGDLPLYLWGKGPENARRIALTIAAFRPDRVVGTIREDDADYAIRLVRRIVADMIDGVRENTGSSETERLQKKLLYIIERSGCDGITISNLTRRTQTDFADPLDRRKALDTLEEAGLIVRSKEAGTGRKTIDVFRYTGG